MKRASALLVCYSTWAEQSMRRHWSTGGRKLPPERWCLTKGGDLWLFCGHILDEHPAQEKNASAISTMSLEKQAARPGLQAGCCGGHCCGNPQFGEQCRGIEVFLLPRCKIASHSFPWWWHTPTLPCFVKASVGFTVLYPLTPKLN